VLQANRVTHVYAAARAGPVNLEEPLIHTCIVKLVGARQCADLIPVFKLLQADVALLLLHLLGHKGP